MPEAAVGGDDAGRILREWRRRLSEPGLNWDKNDLVRDLRRAAASDPGRLSEELPSWIAFFKERRGLLESIHLIGRLELALGLRKPRIGIYDNAFHFIGGAQKYGCTVAAALQEKFDVTLISNADVTLQKLLEWYDLDLSGCRIKTIPIPFFSELKQEVFDAGRVDLKGDNPFHVIGLESGRYDIFVNNCMLEMVYPLSPVSEFVCHFPEREVSRFFHVGRYTHIIYNSRYTAEWIRKRWRLEPHVHLYPPVDMESDPDPKAKENLILSVSRFELSGNKQQLEMLGVFSRMLREYPERMRGWNLVLAGGSTSVNPYLEKLRRQASFLPPGRVEIRVNLSAAELQELYRKARLFWHFSGLHQSDPARIEHFGMTTVEAMQNGVVPLVFDGGGQREVVEEGVSGSFFRDEEDLKRKALRMIGDPSEVIRLSAGARESGRRFTKTVFMEKTKGFFSQVADEYSLGGA